MNWCSINDGTTLDLYDNLKKVMDALSYAVTVANEMVYLGGKFMYLIMPSGWVFPIINEGEWIVPTLPSKRFWAVKISYTNLYGINFSFNIPLPKINIKSWWQSIVAPIDTYIDGSEFWPYIDESGEIKQGLSFEPIKKFGIIEHIPYVVKDILIIWFIVFALEKLGLFGVMRAFVDKITLYVKDRKLKQYIDSSNDLLEGEMDNLKDQIGLFQTETKQGIKSINSKIGVSLRLR